MDADPKRTLFDPTKSRPHVSQQVRFAVEIAYREVPLGRVLHFIQRICALLDSNSVTVPNDFLQLRPTADENLLKFVQFGVRHFCCFSLQLPLLLKRSKQPQADVVFPRRLPCGDAAW
jgi:hypothetical protein